MAKKDSPSPLRRGQFNVIRDTGLTLANIVKRQIREDVGLDVQILMELPGEDEMPSRLPSIAIALVHAGKRSSGYVTEKESREIEEAADGTLQEYTRQAPLPLELHYLVTVYAESHRDELSLLGLAMRALHDQSVIEDSNQIGDSIRLDERPVIEIAETSFAELREIWQCLQLPCRPAFTARAEARLDSEQKRLIRRVREAIVDFKKMDG